MLNLFISTSLPAINSLVASQIAPVPVQLAPMTFGDATSCTITLVDGQGNLSPQSGVGNLQAAIGIAGQTPVTSEFFIPSGTAWVGKLTFNSAALQTLLAGASEVKCAFQVQITDNAGQPQTVCYVPVKILNSVIPATIQTLLGLITGSDGNVYQLSVLVVNGVPTIVPSIFAFQNVTAPTFVTITGNDGNSYNYYVVIVNGIPTLVQE